MKRAGSVGNNKFKECDGQMLVEVLIALTVIVLSVTAAYYVVVTTQDLLLDKKKSDQALLYVEEGAGAVRAIRDRNWHEIEVGTHGLTFDGTNWFLANASDTSGEYTRTVTVTDVATRTKKIVTEVAWNGALGKDRDISTVMYLTDWTVDDLVYDAWLSPSSLGNSDLTPAGNQGEDLALEGAYGYIAAHHAEATSSDLFVYSISDPQNPVVVAHIDTGLGLHAISISEGDTYAYGISENDSNDFKVFDISTPTSPASTTSLSLPGAASAISILSHDGYVYIGKLLDSGDEEFLVVDVSTPSSPSVVGSLEIDANVNGMAFYDDYVYLATSKDDKELIIVDVSTPSSPTEVGYEDIEDTLDALSVLVESHARVFVGRERWNAGPEYYILNASNPSSVTQYSSFEIGDDINDMVNVEWLAFLATSVNNGELNIININDLANPVEHSVYNYPQEAVGIDYEDEYVYTATRSNDALRIVAGD